VVTLNVGSATNGLVRVPLAVTGKWVRGVTTFAITRQDLEEIARNFRERQNGEINVDYDHASEMPEVAAGGPVPSAGRIVRFDPPEPATGLGPAPDGTGLGTRDSGFEPSSAGSASRESRVASRESRFILWGWYEPTERARQLLKSREYRYISPAIDWTALNKLTGKPQGTTLTSVALTNRPFLEELPQIRLSDPAFQAVDESASSGRPIENPKSQIPEVP
jgi:phage I-like protein